MFKKTKNLHFFVAVPAIVWQVLFFYLPLIFILIIGLMKRDFSGLTLEHYKSFLNIVYFKIIFRSLVLAIFNSCVCLLLAYPVAYFLAMRTEKWKNALLFLLILPFWSNFLIQVYSWFFVLGKHGLINDALMFFGVISTPLALLNTTFAIVIVMAYCYLPFMITPLFSVLEKMDYQLLEASLDLGATYWQTFTKVIWPLSFPGIRLGFFLVLVPSFGEFAIPSLLGGEKQMFVGNLISYLFLVMKDYHLGAAFTCFSILILTMIVGLVFFLLRKRG